MKHLLLVLFLCITWPVLAMESNDYNNQLISLLLNWRLYQVLQNSLHLSLRNEPSHYKIALRTYCKLDQDRPTRSKLRELIAAGADVNYAYGYYSMLHWAADSGLEDACFILLNAGANPNTRCVFLGHQSAKATPLLAAIYNKLNYASIRLIEKGADIHESDADDRTPLYHACEQNLMDVCRELIKRGAHINAVEKRAHWTPLLLCASKNNYALCTLLLSQGASLQHRGFMPGSQPLVEIEPRHSALMIAAEHKADAAITAIIEHILFAPKEKLKTFMLCLTRLSKTNHSLREICRQGTKLLKPYLLFNLSQENKAALLNHLNETCNGQLAWNRYPIAMLNPACIDITIQQLIHKTTHGTSQ